MLVLFIILGLPRATHGFAVPSSSLRRTVLRSSPQDMLEEAAALRAEVAAAEETKPMMSPDDAKDRISVALKKATQLRNKDDLQIALSAAEEANFDAKDPIVQKAVTAYNELNMLTDTMRSRLKQEVQSQGADPTVDWNPGYAYIGIFALIAILVVAAGKGIFY